MKKSAVALLLIAILMAYGQTGSGSPVNASQTPEEPTTEEDFMGIFRQTIDSAGAEIPWPKRILNRLGGLTISFQSVNSDSREAAQSRAARGTLNKSEHLGPDILELCGAPENTFEVIYGMTAMSHYDFLTWDQCREAHARALSSIRWARLASKQASEKFRRNEAEDSHDVLERPWLMQGLAPLVRFPTAASVEELALVLEMPSGRYAQSAADALAVCMPASAEPRVRAALRTARAIQAEIGNTLGYSGTNFGRLLMRLEEPRVSLRKHLSPELPDQWGFRLIRPDPTAAAVKDLPSPSSAPAPATVAAVTAPGAGGQGWSWWWLLLLLVPVTAWAALGRKARWREGKVIFQNRPAPGA